jgi:hypothetical protein
MQSSAFGTGHAVPTLNGMKVCRVFAKTFHSRPSLLKQQSRKIALRIRVVHGVSTVVHPSL